MALQSEKALPVLQPVEATGILAAIEMPDPRALKEETKLYRLSIKPSLHFVHVLSIGGWTFTRESFQWEGQGDDARAQFRRGSLARLTDEDLKGILLALWNPESKTGMYVRWNHHKDAQGQNVGVCGVEIVDTNVGTVKGRVFSNGEVGKGPALDVSRLMGGEEPLKNYIDIDLITKDVRDGRTITAKEAQELNEREEVADEAEAQAEIPEPKNSKKVRKSMSTTTLEQQGSAGHVD